MSLTSGAIDLVAVAATGTVVWASEVVAASAALQDGAEAAVGAEGAGGAVAGAAADDWAGAGRAAGNTVPMRTVLVDAGIGSAVLRGSATISTVRGAAVGEWTEAELAVHSLGSPESMPSEPWHPWHLACEGRWPAATGAPVPALSGAHAGEREPADMQGRAVCICCKVAAASSVPSIFGTLHMDEPAAAA